MCVVCTFGRVPVMSKTPIKRDALPLCLPFTLPSMSISHQSGGFAARAHIGATKKEIEISISFMI